MSWVNIGRGFQMASDLVKLGFDKIPEVVGPLAAFHAGSINFLHGRPEIKDNLSMINIEQNIDLPQILSKID